MAKCAGQTGLARFLKRDDGTHVNVRTVRRWAKGEHEVAVEMPLRAEVWRRLEQSILV